MNFKWFAILLLFLLVFDAQAARRGDCNRNMVVIETQTLNFGDYDGTTAGIITVDPSGGRTIQPAPH